MRVRVSLTLPLPLTRRRTAPACRRRRCLGAGCRLPPAAGATGSATPLPAQRSGRPRVVPERAAAWRRQRCRVGMVWRGGTARTAARGGRGGCGGGVRRRRATHLAGLMRAALRAAREGRGRALAGDRAHILVHLVGVHAARAQLSRLLHARQVLRAHRLRPTLLCTDDTLQRALARRRGRHPVSSKRSVPAASLACWCCPLDSAPSRRPASHPSRWTTTRRTSW